MLTAAGALSCGGTEFLCQQDGDCDGAAGGACVQGHCAFPDERCPSGLRFSEHSGGLSGMCVADEGGGTDVSSGSGTGSSAGPDPSTPTDPSTPSSTTLPPLTSEDSGSSGVPDGEVVFRDDELDGEFGAGTFTGTAYTASRLRIADGGDDGTFVSRVFDASADVQWQTLAWDPDAPYGKPLPDDGAAETGYALGNVDMLENVLLFHFDESGALGGGTPIADASGRGNDGAIVGDAMGEAGIAGVFGNAIDDYGGAYVSIPPGVDDFDFGTSDFTWAIWFRFEHDCATNHVFIGVDDVVGGGDPYPHLWLGCTTGQWSECPPSMGEPQPAGVLRAEHDNDMDGVFYCGGGTMNDGAWHHLAIVKVGHMSSEVRLFLDGSRVETATGSFAVPIELTQMGDFAVGGFSGSTYPTEAAFDDAAIWVRALEDEEIEALWLRGVLQLHVEVRVCAMADCADDPPFVGGPDLAPGESFTDPPDALGPSTGIPIAALPVGRYAQYRLQLSGIATTASPAVAAVTMRGVYF